MSNELKPCPFCGGEAKILRTSSGYDCERKELYGNYRIHCTKCKLDFHWIQVSVTLSDDGDLTIVNNREKVILEYNRRQSGEKA